ncbi:hypothetical protein MC7420_6126 [Coleofasciculus chthonoplastes PCC 7420]|uniref:Uncharacterized protein n=1 Tax=Coleofasciculus chthonoplastes PCC 7420 TaxID=118168 RepID=B4VTV1_9CYAN|nr:hypothetical protein MC7420_6126 [Coleofasciculus chthonoplastes PCC 7420]
MNGRLPLRQPHRLALKLALSHQFFQGEYYGTVLSAQITLAYLWNDQLN